MLLPLLPPGILTHFTAERQRSFRVIIRILCLTEMWEMWEMMYKHFMCVCGISDTSQILPDSSMCIYASDLCKYVYVVDSVVAKSCTRCKNFLNYLQMLSIFNCLALRLELKNMYIPDIMKIWIKSTWNFTAKMCNRNLWKVVYRFKLQNVLAYAWNYFVLFLFEQTAI